MSGQPPPYIQPVAQRSNTVNALIVMVDGQEDASSVSQTPL